MSTTVDSRVVEMRFDNKQFESGVATTITSLEKLKQNLKLDGATKGMENIDAAAKKVDMSSLGSAVEGVGLKFNALWTIADQALRNITNSVYATAANIAKSLTIDPISTGLQEYETQINAVQTILANTESKGTTLTDVNKALDELNTYADKTIYNFTEMTRNIGTFTAAGVDLDTSVNAIQGIANLAAVSGSSSQQASTAMYQLSQAMASGTVKLMDWNSVVNAGMGGQVFQDALKETAKAHGVNVDAMINKHGSFRETLKEEWITTDILTETLSHFTMAAEEGSKQWNEYKKSLMDSGYTEEQALAILKMSNTATDAATKVKTATQLFDTLKETAQSGWTQTWELIMGDFEEAKNLFSMLYETLAPIIEASSKARNDILKGWAEGGGRNDLIESLQNIFKAIGSIVKPIKDAFNDIFPATLDDKVKGLLNFTKGLKEFTAKLTLGDKASENLRRTFKGLFALLDISKQIFGALVKLVSPLFSKFMDLNGGILSVSGSIGDWLVGLNESIKASGFLTTAVEKIHGAFEKVEKFLQPVIEGIKKFGNEVTKNLTAVANNAETRLGPLSAMGNFIMAVFTGIGNVIKKVFPFVSAAASAVGKVLGELMSRISDAVQNADYDGLLDFANGGIFAAIGVFIAKFIKSGGDLLDNASGFLDNIKGILGEVSNALNAFTESIKAETLKKIATAIGILAVSLLVLSLIPSEQLTSSLVAITTLFGELLLAMELLSRTGEVKKVGKVATALIALSSAMLTLSIALKIMSTMSWSEMGVGLTAMTVGLGELIGAVWLLAKMPEKELKKSTKAIKQLASSLVVLAIALKIMGSMSWKEMGVGLISMTVGLGALVAAVNLLPKDTAKRAAGLIGLATAMVILGAALKIMGSMSWGELAVGLVALGGSLGILIGAMHAMKSAIPGAVAMLIVAPALVVLAGALKILSTMDWDGVAKGLVALGGSLGIIAGAMYLMQGSMGGAAALVVVAAALLLLTPVLMALGSMSLAEIGKALLVLAGAFTVFGVAAAVLTPVVGTMIKLAAAFALLGVACVAIGAGILMIGAGITALAGALASGGAAIVVFVSSIISLIPFLIEQIGVGIVKLVEVIAGAASSICSAISVIVVSVVDMLITVAPKLIEGLMTLVITLLEGLITYLPQIVPLLVTLIVSLLELLAGYAGQLVAGIFTFIGAVINAIASNLSLLIEPLVNLFVTIFQGIADVLGPVVETVIAPILDILCDMIVGLFEVLAPYMPIIKEMFVTIATVVSDAIVKITEALAPFIPDITHMIETITTVVTNGIVRITEVLTPFLSNVVNLIQGVVNAIVAIIQEISPIIDSITNLIRTLGDIISEVMQGIVDTITACSTLISDALSGIEGIFDSVFNGIAEIITSVGDSIKSVLDGIAGIIDSIGEAALNAGTGFENLAKGVKIITDLKLGDMVASLTAVATGVGSIASHSGGIKDVGSGMTKLSTGALAAAVGFQGLTVSISTMSTKLSSVKTILSDLVSAFTKASSTMVKAGVQLMVSVIAGIDSQKKKLATTAKSAIKQFVDAIKTQQVTAKKACTTMVTSCATAIKNKSSAFKTAGKELIKGFAKGISENTYLATAKAKAMAEAADDAARKALGINSPSRVFKEIGSGIPEGFAMGITMFGSSIKNSVNDMSNTAIGAINKSISRISDIINSDIDSQPTIRPVLDLGGVQSGVSALSGMLDMDSTVGVRANLSAISSMMSARGQNGSNADVVSAIDKLGKKLNDIGNSTTYQINGITYDDGSNITDAVATLVRAARIERRV